MQLRKYKLIFPGQLCNVTILLLIIDAIFRNHETNLIQLTNLYAITDVSYYSSNKSFHRIFTLRPVRLKFSA